METRDPNLTKTRINDTERERSETLETGVHHHTDDHHHHAHVQNPITDTMQETVIGSGFLEPNELQDTLDPEGAPHHSDGTSHSSVHHNTAPLHESRREELAAMRGHSASMNSGNVKNTDTMQETVIGYDRLGGASMDDNVLHDSTLHDSELARGSELNQSHVPAESRMGETTLKNPQTDAMAVEELQASRAPMDDRAEERINERDIDAHTYVESGTDKFDSDVMQTEHVNAGDNPAREPDRRDQEGSPFDGDINEETTGTEMPKSDFIDDHNRYASVDNAQSRTLTPDEEDDTKTYNPYE